MTAYKEIKTADNTFIAREKMTGMFQELYSGNLSSPVYVQQSKGWSINSAGALDVRYIYADEMHVKAFYADLELALAGGERITPSVAKIASNFTIPTAGNSSTLVVEELSGYTGQVFRNGDILGIRQYERTAWQTLTIGDVWGTVTYVTRSPYSNPPTQTYTFTRSTGGNAGTGSGTVTKGTLALDYGVSGQGYYEVTTIDGIAGANSPYAQIVTWTTHPATGTTIKSRMGNLSGITTATWGAISDFGFYGNKVYIEGDCYIKGVITVTAGSNVEIGATAGATWGVNLGGIPSYLASTAPDNSLSITSTFIGFHATGTNWPIRIANDSGTGKFYAGNSSDKYMSWDGTDLIIQGQIQSNSAGQRIVLDPTYNTLDFYDSSGKVGFIQGYAGELSVSGTGGFKVNTTGILLLSGSSTDFLIYSNGKTIDIGSSSPYGSAASGIILGAAVTLSSTINGYTLGSACAAATTDFAAASHNHDSDYEPLIDHCDGPVTLSNTPYGWTLTVDAIQTGNAYQDLSDSSKIGTGATQVAAGDHSHNGLVTVGSKNASSVYASKTNGGATDDQLKTLPLEVAGYGTVYVLIDEWV